MADKAASETSAACPDCGREAKTKAEVAVNKEASESAEKAAESEAVTEAASDKTTNGGLPFTVKDGRVSVVSKARAGKKIIAKTGEPIEFDGDGRASVRVDDAVYLSAISGFEFE